jgi:hypothetical protein
VGCRVDEVRSYVGSASYLSSYLTQAKKIVDPDDDREQAIRQSDTGKMWGCIGKGFLPIRWESDTLTGPQGVQATRIMRKWRERRGTFFLHSKQSHTMKKNWGKPVAWRRLRLEKMKTFEGAAISSVADWLRMFRESGFKIRRCRPRLFRRLTRDVWSLDVASGKYEKNGTEIHSACSGWHFIDVKHFGKLMRFVKGTGAASSLTGCEERWLKNGTVGHVRRVRDVRIDGSRLAGRSPARGVAGSALEDLRGLHECGWFDAPPVEQSGAS